MKRSEMMIISNLRNNARQSLTRMGRKTSIPISTIYEKIRCYEEGIIKKYTVIVDFGKLGFATRVSMLLKTTKEKQIYTTILSKQADCTYSHTVKILNGLEKLGLVSFEKTGRIKTVRFTDEGKEVAANLDSIVKKLAQLKEKIKEEKKEEKPTKEKKK